MFSMVTVLFVGIGGKKAERPLTHTRCNRGCSEFTGIQFRGGHILHLQQQLKQVTEDIIFNLVSSYTPATSYDNKLITMSKN